VIFTIHQPKNNFTLTADPFPKTYQYYSCFRNFAQAAYFFQEASANVSLNPAQSQIWHGFSGI